MNSIPRHQARNSARSSFALLSVLALLALACFPVLAQAEDASGVQYETAVPTVTGHTTPPPKAPGGGTPANSSTANGGSTHTNASGSDSSGNPSGANGNPSTGSGSGTEQGSQSNGSPANGKSSGQQGGSVSGGQPLSSSQTSSDDSSSPLIPILIAIAALAAISIGAVVIRQRRQRHSSGAQVSPKAS